MAQYQSFPEAPGDSLTLDKLKHLSLPELEGKRFLDVGCNEGFFCGFADFMGAARSVGIDHSRGFIERARHRFPRCEFHARGWERLPEGEFDVILLASALHYADDQEALLHRLVGHLAQDGVLVVELGIYSSKKSEWMEVKRGSDVRLFPSMPKLREVLASYAWKWMGPSVSQAGDPVSRHVLHISRRRRAAYLLMQPPAFGKSSIARALFPSAGVPVVTGDLVIGRIAAGKLKAPQRLANTIKSEYSPFRIDSTIQRIFQAGLAEELVSLWLKHAGDGDFAVDMYVPSEHQDDVKRLLSDAGYLPVVLDWQRPGASLMDERRLVEKAEDFYMSLTSQPKPDAVAGSRVMGFIDEAQLKGGRLTLRGWAADAGGTMPASLTVRVGDTMHAMDVFERQLRPDVQRHLKLPHALVGYRLSVPAPGAATLDSLRGRVGIQVDGDDFLLAKPLAAVLAGEGEP